MEHTSDTRVSIRTAGSDDLAEVLDIHHRAFGQSEEAELVAALLRDPTAEPALSLLAIASGAPIGHILLTRTSVATLSTSILCPLAVVPEAQGSGAGGALVRAGLDALRASGQDAVFVLGHPGYYPRFGFTPAGAQGFNAPYPIPPEHADAWMVCRLSDRAGSGRVTCAGTLMDEKYWIE